MNGKWRWLRVLWVSWKFGPGQSEWKTNMAFATPEFPLPGKEGDDAQLLVKSMYLTLLFSLLWLPFGLKDQHSEMGVN